MSTSLTCSPIPAVDRLFRDFFEGPGLLADGAVLAHGGAPPVLDLSENGEGFLLEVELPGLALEDLEISVLGDQLTLKGEIKRETPEGATFLHRERRGGSFTRILRLPTAIDSGRVEAALKDGILTVRLPKAQEALPRRIEVTAS
ncbi:MAG: Hsp20/alpha crystallin family protein [Planctomycetota bacterium]